MNVARPGKADQLPATLRLSGSAIAVQLEEQSAAVASGAAVGLL